MLERYNFLIPKCIAVGIRVYVKKTAGCFLFPNGGLFRVSFVWLYTKSVCSTHNRHFTSQLYCEIYSTLLALLLWDTLSSGINFF